MRLLSLCGAVLCVHIMGSVATAEQPAPTSRSLPAPTGDAPPSAPPSPPSNEPKPTNDQLKAEAVARFKIEAEAKAAAEEMIADEKRAAECKAESESACPKGDSGKSLPSEGH